MKSTIRLAGVAGALGVALGAFGAHALKDHLGQLGTAWIWEKAVLYHLVHAVVLLALGLGQPVRRWIPTVFAAGIVLFSGSLYILALTNIKWLGAITPFGGVCFIAGWIGLICCAGRESQRD